VLLWVVWSLQQYRKANPTIFTSKYASFLFSILDYILANKHPNLTVNEETGLVSTDGRNVAVSWMNSTLNGRPIIPRSGYLVEFNALWYNALKFGQEIAELINDQERTTKYGEMSYLVQRKFVITFLNDAGYLYDYVDGSYKDPNVRPNMIFAVSLDYSPLERSQKIGHRLRDQRVVYRIAESAH